MTRFCWVWMCWLLAAGSAVAENAQQRAERLVILLNEHADLVAQLTQAESKQPQDEKAIGSLHRNLEALNKEIAHVRAQPLQSNTWNEGKTAKAVAAKKPPQPRPPSSEKFADWDVFRNFVEESANEE